MVWGLHIFMDLLAPCPFERRLKVEDQRTIGRSVSLKGIGLHTGEPVAMTLRPAPVGTGVLFRRIDLGENAFVEARLENVVDVHYATTIAKGGVEVKTIEHLMAAFFGLGVDNVVVELDSREVPAVDGSAYPFVELILEAGLKPQPTPRTVLKVRRPITVDLGHRSIRLIPSETFKVIYTMAFDHPLFGEQTVALTLSAEGFIKEIAKARTYGFLKDVEQLRRMGLAKGGSLENAIIIGETGVLNGGLRYRDELVRHKILDLLGDLYLLGKPLVGTIIAYGAGHLLHAKLVKAIQRQFELEELTLTSSEPLEAAFR